MKSIVNFDSYLHRYNMYLLLFYIKNTHNILAISYKNCSFRVAGSVSLFAALFCWRSALAGGDARAPLAFIPAPG
ncbi:MAG: hypothetical protein LBI48_01035 [Burkholderiaceae bacterium]|jgi:hypothetical protein|nr:hypothetical protein [Burkholderiaceae bacterium]